MANLFEQRGRQPVCSHLGGAGHVCGEAVVIAGQQLDRAAGHLPAEPFAVGVGNDLVGHAMEHEHGAVVFRGGLVDWQAEGGLDIVAAEPVAEDVDIFRGMPGVVGRTHCASAQGVVAQNCRRGHQHRALQHRTAELSGSHRGHDSALGMPEYGDAVGLRHPAHIVDHCERVVYLVEHRHVHEFALAPAVAVEVAAYRSYSELDEVVGDSGEQGFVLVAHEAVADDHDGAFFAFLQFGELEAGGQAAHGAVDEEGGVGLG